MDSRSIEREFIQTMQRFKRMQMLEAFSSTPRGEFVAMEILAQHQREHPCAEGLYGGELAARMHVTPPAVSRMLRHLEEKGFIERTVDTQDRRNTYIRLTRVGEAVRERKKEEMAAFMEGVIAEMGEDNMRQLLALWNRLIDHMESEAQAYMNNQNGKGEQA
ncbi:MarR family transcriptional regulator [Eubacteriales bacterium OttesenSCG-928-A19]|nr:MarR family transcriptional regulator [Eubacteriales bacterium OttesenSCG-928-A19]